ncbi:MAG: serine hydrolase domain-containing protein [Opitutus sp.]
MFRTCIILGLSAAAAFAANGNFVNLPRSTPEAEGVSSEAILRFVDQAEARVDAIHSFMLVRHGRVVAEGWWSPYAADEPHVMFSLSKSFTSTGVGLAIAEGKLSLDDPILNFFPDESPASPSQNLKAMRVRDLLSMSTGHHESDISSFPFGSKESLVKAFLALPVAHKPGTHFVYNTPASYMLSAIVQKVSGQPLLEYLGPRLFQPLGIEGATWEASAQGVSMGGFGLKVRTEDIARFGQLDLQKGEWNGRPLMPASWVEAATARQTSNGSNPDSDWDQGYGYHFWRTRHGFYRGDGAFGQFCIVMPQYDAVVAITSGTRDMGRVMNLIWDLLLPGIQPGALPSDPAAQQKLAGRLSHLTLAYPIGEATSPTLDKVVGRRYRFGPNAAKIESLAVEKGSADGELSFIATVAGVEVRIAAAHHAWKKGSVIVNGLPEPVAASGSWKAPDTYLVRVPRYQTPFMTTYQMRFAGDLVLLDTEENAGFGPLKSPQIVGEAK